MKKFFVSLLALLLLPDVALAQDVTSTRISGSVVDDFGYTIAVARVTLTSRDVALQSQVTDGSGRFAFTNVAAGQPYVITVEKLGFETSASGLGNLTLARDDVKVAVHRKLGFVRADRAWSRYGFVPAGIVSVNSVPEGMGLGMEALGGSEGIDLPRPIF